MTVAGTCERIMQDGSMEHADFYCFCSFLFDEGHVQNTVGNVAELSSWYVTS